MSIDAVIIVDERFKDRDILTFTEVILDKEVTGDDATMYLSGDWTFHDLVVEAVGVEAFAGGSLKITCEVFEKIEEIYDRWLAYTEETEGKEIPVSNLELFIRDVNYGNNRVSQGVDAGYVWYVCDRDSVYLDSCFGDEKEYENPDLI